MVFIEENSFKYHHPNFIWRSHHFIFGDENPRFRIVSIYLREQVSRVFPGRPVIVVSQFFSSEGEWGYAALKFPQIEIMASCPDFDEIIELVNLGVKITKDADAFFDNPRQWLDRPVQSMDGQDRKLIVSQSKVKNTSKNEKNA